MINLQKTTLTINEIEKILSFGLLSILKSLPKTHQEQISVLDIKSSKTLYDNFHKSEMIRGCDTFRYDGLTWSPFPKDHFSEFRNYKLSSKTQLKKWLFNCGIPFKNSVFLLSDGDRNAIVTTWKIVVKHSDTIFWADDSVVFDESHSWCLFYHHEGDIYFGRTFHRK
ncbi:hypothetical protein SAMN05660293_00499 [Dyadobacter psychrophilus]|uniref:Uncharacterized protein n=1 Tax=Dyadobacter psychrophilus TaxID=651661 RepID=A0A1T5BNV5_9BACT|nr:hypothetical protein SAMN05660293_00499 [Dyadobacter psychrophilus]